jgi:hypothetical protein
MPRLQCPFLNNGAPCDTYKMQQNTLMQHVIQEHLEMGDIDYILQQCVTNFNPTQLKCTCTTKNKFKTRRDFCAHYAHRHCDDLQLDFIQDAFFAENVNEKFTTKEKLEEIAKRVSEKETIKFKKESLATLKKPMGARRSKSPSNANVSFDEDSGYKSGGSDHTQINSDTPFNPIQNEVLRNKLVYDGLIKAYNRFHDQYGDNCETPENFYGRNPKADTAKHYVDYLKRQVESMQLIKELAGVDLNDPADVVEELTSDEEEKVKGPVSTEKEAVKGPVSTEEGDSKAVPLTKNQKKYQKEKAKKAEAKAEAEAKK